MRPAFAALLPALLFLSSCSRDEVSFQAWVADPHHRVYHGSFGRDLSERHIRLEGGRNEHVFFQLAVKSAHGLEGVSVEVSDLEGTQQTISNSLIRVRYPGFLPVDETGRLTPDPLFERPSIGLRSNQAQPIWIDWQIPSWIVPGIYRGTASVQHRGRSAASFEIELEVLYFTFPPLNQDNFYFNILMDPGSVARMHNVERWSEAHWVLLEKYVRNWAEHSQDAITVFFIEDPWEGITGFPVASVVDWRLPGAWEELENPEFQFEFSNFDRFVQMCLDAGIDENLQAWSPVNMPHSDYAVITYEDTRARQTRTLKVTAGDADYERVWSQFARSFAAHLRERNWLEMTTVGLDELRTANLDRIVPIFRREAPDLKLMVSGGDEKGRYSDLSHEVAFHFGMIGSKVPLPDTAARRRQGKRTLLYTAVSPLRPNTFLFSKPLESRMLPWIVWKHGFDGYIRWAWNFWVDGFWGQPRYRWHSGDMFLVYPGAVGPLDSIRSQMLRKGAQDYECLRMIRRRLDRIRDPERVKAVEAQVRQAIELATREADPQPPRMALPSDIEEARRRLNRVLRELISEEVHPDGRP